MTEANYWLLPWKNIYKMYYTKKSIFMKLMWIYLCCRSNKHTHKRHFQIKNVWKFENIFGFMLPATGVKSATDV